MRVEEKEREKVEKYQDLMRGIGRLWKLKQLDRCTCRNRSPWKCHQGFDRWIEKLGITFSVGVVQKTALLGTVRILRKVLEMGRDNSVSPWSFVVTRLTEEITAMTTART